MKFAALALLLLFAGCKTTSGVVESKTPNQSQCLCSDGCPQGCKVDDGLSTSYRKVERDPTATDSPTSERAEAFAALDVSAGEPLQGDDVTALAGAAKVDSADILTAFRADVVRGRGTEHAILTRTGKLIILKDGEVFATLDLGEPLQDNPAEIVKLVDDRVEIVIRHHEAEQDLLTVCRVIGRDVGRVFETRLAGAEVEFVHLGEERAIRVRSASGKADVYRWNPWEGMFRVPAVAPTAPR